MLAPPQARRLEPGGAAEKEAVNTHSNARFGREVEWNVSGNDCFLRCLKSRSKVAQFCELYPQHRTVVSASPVTVGALDYVRYPDQSGEYRLTESFIAVTHNGRFARTCRRPLPV
jgi:hypothetical protein